MLFPSQFKNLTQDYSFRLGVEEVTVNGECKGPADILVSYDERGSPILHLGEFFTQKDLNLEPDIKIKYKSESEPWSIFTTKFSIKSGADNTCVTCEARLQRVPLILLDSPSSTRLEAVLLSAPRFFSKAITLQDHDGNIFDIEPFKSDEGASCLVKSDISLNACDPLKPLLPFVDFLTFARGAHCGFGNLFAYDESDSVAFRLLGFLRHDVKIRETNWFDLEIQKDLPEVFSLFSKAAADEVTYRALRQSINFYRASNASRDVSVEMSIIAAHSALEAIVNFILEYHAGWSNSLMKNDSVKFSDKTRAAALHFRMQGDLLSESPELLKYSKSNNNIDIFDIVSRVRNKLVHQNMKNYPSGIQLHEAWLSAQWLVEVLIFGVIGYRGEIIDRRVYKGWRGTTCQIPLSGCK